jgi:hypothetical protein
MKKLLLLTLVGLMCASPAFADNIVVASDASGTNCAIAPGFSSTATVIHRFTAGTTGSRFKVEIPAGTQFFSFATPFVPIGNLISDLSLGYGQCLTGSFALGTIVAIWTEGVISVVAADGFPNIIVTDCLFAELPATGATSYVQTTPVDCTSPVDPTTWGKVKSLYR